MSGQPVTVHHADALEALRAMPDNSVDSIVTDPPYGLAEHKPATIAAALTAWTNGDREHVPDGRGFMGRRWDAFVPPPAVWDEAMRVLKPGGHLLAFAGSRTADLMGISIRLAGFEMRDTITWHYASGFPKSLDVSKAIDKARDDRGDIVKVTTWLKRKAWEAGHNRATVDAHMGTSDMAGWWLTDLRHRCQCPTWEQWERLRDLLGFDDTMDAEVWRLNGRKGTPGEAWDAREVIGTKFAGIATPGDVDRYTVGGSRAVEVDVTAPATEAAQHWQGWGTALKPASEPIVVARKPLGGTVAACVLTHGTGALNIDGCRVEGGSNRPLVVSDRTTGNRVYGDGLQGSRAVAGGTDLGRWPANVVLTHAPDCGPDDTAPCVDGCPVAELDTQSGRSTSRAGQPRSGAKGDGWRMTASGTEHNDEGGASRFFPTFRYQAKAPTRERPSYVTDDGRKIAHPTVKPLALIRWLVRLVTPPGGLVVDPFAGSGTTGEAAVLEGFRAVLVELDGDHLPLIAERLTRVLPAVEPLAPTVPSTAEVIAAEARTARRDSPHPALRGYRCCATPADYADLRDL